MKDWCSEAHLIHVVCHVHGNKTYFFETTTNKLGSYWMATVTNFLIHNSYRYCILHTLQYDSCTLHRRVWNFTHSHIQYSEHWYPLLPWGEVQPHVWNHGRWLPSEERHQSVWEWSNRERLMMPTLHRYLFTSPTSHFTYISFHVHLISPTSHFTYISFHLHLISPTSHFIYVIDITLGSYWIRSLGYASASNSITPSCISCNLNSL